MVANKAEFLRLELRSVIKFLVAEKCKPCEIYRRMCDVYVRHVRNRIQDKDRLVKPTMVRIPEMIKVMCPFSLTGELQ